MAPKVIVFCGVLAITTILFGWNLAELNAPEVAIRADLGLSDAQIGIASSIFAIGGLVGAFLAGLSMKSMGRKSTLLAIAFVYLVGGLMKASAMGITMLAAGRFISGIAAGCGAVVCPIIIMELAPPASKGKFGAITQVSINLGILTTQVLGIFLGKPKLWRLVLLIGGLLGAAQAILLTIVPESPAYLYKVGKKEEARKALIRLRGSNDIEEEFSSFSGALVEGAEAEPLLPTAQNIVGLGEFATARKYRWSLMLVVGIMLAQQFTGINAVVMYGVAILGKLLPAYAPALNAGISAVNLIVTLGASSLFDRVSHKLLLTASILGMGSFAAILSLGMHFEIPALSAIGTFFFVASFSIGLGPLPWMVAVRNVEPNAVESAQSLAIAANWIGTFTVSFGVPVLASAIGMDGLFFGFAVVGYLVAGWAYVVLP